MFKQVSIFLFGVLFLVVPTQSARLSHNNRDELYSEREKKQLERQEFMSDKRSINRAIDSSESLDVFHLIRSLMHNKRAFNNAQRQFQEEMLQAHNDYRARHCVRPLVLDDTLSNSAQSYAEKLAATNTFEHSRTPGLGENLWMKSSSRAISSVNGQDGTNKWYAEIQYYHYNQAGFSSKTGHFTQVVWKSTTKMGVGMAYTTDRKKVYAVAQYSPPGNYKGQFESNVLPPRC